MRAATLLAPALLVGLAGSASAKSQHTTVTPGNIQKQTFPALDLTVKDVGGLKRFEIVVKERASAPARFVGQAELRLAKDGRTVARCPVASQERKQDVVFTFSVAPDWLDGATFQVAYIAHTRVRDKQGAERWVGMPSGNFLTFPLKEFAKAGKASRTAAPKGEVALRRITLGVAYLRKCWGQIRVLLGREERRKAAAVEGFGKRQFDRFNILNDNDFGSFQRLVDEAEAQWKKALSVRRRTERGVRTAELDLAVEDARFRLEAAKLERALFRLQSFPPPGRRD